MKTQPGFSDNEAPLQATILSVILITLFGVYAFLYSRVSKDKLDADTLEYFLTARNSITAGKIGWSLFASAMGSWVITGPAEFGYYGGILGVVAYAFASAMPIMLIAYFGGKIKKAYPELLSLSDFVLWRFGRKTQILVMMVTLFNMSIAATAEFTTISSLYGDFVGLGDFTAFVVVLIAIVTLSYSAYGGLKASIVTDQAQGVIALFLVQVVAIYLFADFNKSDITQDIEERGFNASFHFNDALKGTTRAGYGSLFTLPFSLSAATVFSEAFWQRSWAAADDQTLLNGSWFGSLMIFLVVGFFGAVGLLVAWANLVEDPFSFNSNLFAFQAFSKEAGSDLVSSGIGVMVLLLATTMAQGAIDSFQNGIAASVSGAVGRFLEGKESLKVGRVILVVLNIPFVIVGLQKYSVLSLFLLGNMMCVCAFFPVMLGFFTTSPFHPYFRDFIPPLCFCLTIFATIIFGGVYFDGATFGEGVTYAFWGNTFYEFEYFLAPLFFTVFFTFSCLGAVKFLNLNTLDVDEDRSHDKLNEENKGNTDNQAEVEKIGEETGLQV